MDNRKLLEMAAKAAGIAVKANYDMSAGLEIATGVGRWWNPLTHDGDALRLAVKLGLDVRVYPTRMEPYTGVHGASGYVEEAHMVDAYRATRRAIVRAAAKIGRAM